MFGYATLGTNDIDSALAFYDALLATAGDRWRPLAASGSCRCPTIGS